MSLSITTRIRPYLSGFVGLAMGLTLAFTVSTAKADRWQLIVRTARSGAGELPILVEVKSHLRAKIRRGVATPSIGTSCGSIGSSGAIWQSRPRAQHVASGRIPGKSRS